MWVFFIETVFSLGLFLNALLFIPQMIRLYQKKNSRELSLLTFAGFNFIQFFTILHGYLNNDYLLMIGFVLSFISCGMVTAMIVYYRLVE